MAEKYRTPSFNEMVVGFKCQTCYAYFIEDEARLNDEWVDIEFTQEFYDEHIEMIKADAYEIEFRVKINS